MTATITRTVNARCDTDPSVTACQLVYDLGDPFAIGLVFLHVGGATTLWRVDRQLIDDVLAFEKAGNVELGDALFERRASSIVCFLRVDRPDEKGWCEVALPLEDVAIFHAATVGACRLGEEPDVFGDDAIREWVGDGAL